MKDSQIKFNDRLKQQENEKKEFSKSTQRIFFFMISIIFVPLLSFVVVYM